jgi:hypothetical protein
MTYRPTSLRLASRHCPSAVVFYEQDRAYFRDHFAVGIAAHAVLEALGHARRQIHEQSQPWEQIEVIADRVAKQLMTTGRTFDGRSEPPLSPDAVVEGRDLALRWAQAAFLGAAPPRRVICTWPSIEGPPEGRDQRRAPADPWTHEFGRGSVAIAPLDSDPGRMVGPGGSSAAR